MIKFTKDERDKIRGGDLSLLKKRLEELDRELVRNLKYYKEDTRAIQGAAQVTDALLKILQ